MRRKCMFWVVIILLLGVCACNRKENNGDCEFGKNEWALYNYGQEINGTPGAACADINMRGVRELIGNPSRVVVGLVDTGVEFTSKDINNILWKNQDEIADNGIDDDKNGYIDDVYGWDFYNRDASMYDDYLYDYHGTYIANMLGKIVPNVEIVSSKFMKGTQGDAIDAIEAIEYAIQNGAEIINCSWCFEREEEQLYTLISENSDVLFVCAAGNSNLNLDEVQVYPASYSLDNVISVMAIGNTGEKYERSGYGLNVDIASPGKDIEVVLPEGDVTYVSGTSIATVFVSSAAALLKSYDQELTPYEIKTILIESAHRTQALKGMCKAGGFLDVQTAIIECK